MFSKKSISSAEKVKISVKSIYEGHFRVTYRGIKAVKCPFDYVIYQMILSEVKPDLVIEVGTNVGGGALYLADLLEGNGKGMVHTIDIFDDVHPKVKEHDRIKIFSEGWENYNVEEAENFKTVLVIDDASHTYNDSIGILEKFSYLVSKGSYFIVEDGIVNNLGLEKEFSGGPLKAIREFLGNHEEFIIDRKWCDLFGKNSTFNVNGYLKKR